MRALPVCRQCMRNKQRASSFLRTDIVSLKQSQMVRVFGLQCADQKLELGKAS
jgi:hypothetical protein